MRTLCWDKLAKDYRLKSLLFLAFTRAYLFKSLRLYFLPRLGGKKSCESRGKKVSGKKNEQNKKRLKVQVGAPPLQRGPDVDDSMKEQMTED